MNLEIIGKGAKISMSWSPLLLLLLLLSKWEEYSEAGESEMSSGLDDMTERAADELDDMEWKELREPDRPPAGDAIWSLIYDLV